MKQQITGRSKVLGIIGHPVGHSASPAMHNLASELLGEDYVYVAFDIEEQEAGKALDAMRTLGICGYNVTMPCKKAVIPFLDDISEEAQIMGAVNTIVNDHGTLTGYNTDGKGMMQSLRQAGAEIAGSHLTLFGTGGAATAILVQSVVEGAKEVDLYNRAGTPNKELAGILTYLAEHYPQCHIRLFAFEQQEQIKNSLAESQIAINATPLGMAPQIDSTPVADPSWFHKGLTVADAVYNPRETRFLQDAHKAGGKIVDGTGMLLWQGVEAYKLFTGADMPADKIYQALFAPKE